ncbi:Plug domain-containing protein [Novosphingobium resinovorum]|uniref:Plug domain-containing protein n=1 Tax=Novosphingobium resinovorum TaxID=158500 RepID=UPI002ED5B96C|nr:Plug domain-containing protein [Novosphingobium resinovorum]
MVPFSAEQMRRLLWKQRQSVPTHREPFMHKRSIIRITLVAGASILSTVIATSAYTPSAAEDNKPQDIVVTGLRQAYIGDMPVQDIPQNIQSIDGTKLQGLGLTRLDTALDLVSGVAHLNNFGGLWDGYAIRGFAGDANNVPAGFLVNGFNARGFSGSRTHRAPNASISSRDRPLQCSVAGNPAAPSTS